MSTPHFHALRVTDVRRETPDCVSLALKVPPALADRFRYTQGQYLNVRRQIGGAQVRRSYSICSGLDDGELRIAVKEVERGLFSGWANRGLAPGMTLEVMPPEGRFFVPLEPAQSRHYVAFAAGSGITPVLSLARTILAREPGSRFTLVYGNRTLGSVIFNEALEDLKDRYMARFALYHVFSRDVQAVELFNGRVDGAKVGRFLDTLIAPESIDEAFICGPASMGDEIKAVLEARGVPAAHIHLERFGAPPPVAGAVPRKARTETAGQKANVTVIVDGVRFDLDLPEDGPSVLDAALKAGADLPYACKAGVCCTCRARLVEGEVRMDANYTLEAAEVKAGYRLTCQSHPITPRVVLDFDQR